MVQFFASKRDTEETFHCFSGVFLFPSVCAVKGNEEGKENKNLENRLLELKLG